MADTLYLSLWYPNLRLQELAGKLTAVLGAFAGQGGEARVYSATVWPMSWSETPILQQVYGRRLGAAAGPMAAAELGAEPQQAVAGALELLHEDYAYEFQIGWSLWEPEMPADAAGAEPGWARRLRLVRVTGFGPLFDEGAYEQDGHIRIDLGSDAPFLEEDLELDSAAARRVEENVRQLIGLAGAAEKASGATARLLWSEMGESLARRLATRLGVVN